MEYKLFGDTPKFHDAEFYQDRPVSDHINEEGHRPRLLQVLNEVGYLVKDFPIHSVADFGAGNGGLLNAIREKHGHLRLWGYDLQPKNIEWAQDVYKVQVYSDDITVDDFIVEASDVIILTEVLEHLVDPHSFLKKLNSHAWFSGDFDPPRFIVASSPANENQDQHYEFHLWAWTETSFPDMFRAGGWTVEKHFILGSTQFVVASRRSRTPEETAKTMNAVKDYLKKNQRRWQRIVEIGGTEVAGYFSMGHICFAKVEDPEEAISAARKYPWLNVSTKDWEVNAEVIVDGTKVMVKNYGTPEKEPQGMNPLK